MIAIVLLYFAQCLVIENTRHSLSQSGSTQRTNHDSVTRGTPSRGVLFSLFFFVTPNKITTTNPRLGHKFLVSEVKLSTQSVSHNAEEGSLREKGRQNDNGLKREAQFKGMIVAKRITTRPASCLPTNEFLNSLTSRG